MVSAMSMTMTCIMIICFPVTVHVKYLAATVACIPLRYIPFDG